MSFKKPVNFTCSFISFPLFCLFLQSLSLSLPNIAPLSCECLASMKSIFMVVEEGQTVGIKSLVVCLRAAGTVGFDVISLVVGVFVSLHVNVGCGTGISLKLFSLYFNFFNVLFSFSFCYLTLISLCFSQVEYWRGGWSMVSCRSRFPEWVRIPSGQTLRLLCSDLHYIWKQRSVQSLYCFLKEYNVIVVNCEFMIMKLI